MTRKKIYAVIIDRVSDFIRQELSVQLFITKEDAQSYFWALVKQAKEHPPDLDDEEELIEESESGMWQVYLSGDWAYYHIQVLIRVLEVNTPDPIAFR